MSIKGTTVEFTTKESTSVPPLSAVLPRVGMYTDYRRYLREYYEYRREIRARCGTNGKNGGGLHGDAE